MKVGLVAVHYPRPEHRDEMIARVHRAAEVMAAAPDPASTRTPPRPEPCANPNAEGEA